MSLTYYMNLLQTLDAPQHFCVTLNRADEIDPSRVIRTIEYEHPVFTTAALEAQKQLHRIQGRDHTWYAGAWTGYGFHEDGMRSGVEVAQALGATLPWDVGQVHASRDLTLVPEIVRKAA